MNRILGVLIVLALTALASCDSQLGSYFYTANVQGYVMDSKTDGGGVSNATVYLYAKDPSADLTADATKVPAGFLVSTSTSNGNNAGQYTSKVIWNNANGAYGTKGDTTTIYAVVIHPDYATTAFTINGVLSDFTNNLVDLKVKRITFTTAQVTGQIIDVNGNGVNNVRVVCFLDPAAPAGTAPDYTATTATVNNVVGTFTFNNVTWKDAAATTAISEHTVLIKVDDNNYSATDTLSPKLISGSDSDLSSTPVSVTRNPTSSFSTNLGGRILNRITGANGSTDSGVSGVHVKVTWTDDNGAHTAEADTNAQGNWTVFVAWKDTTPGDYASADSSIPTGEDGLVATVDFTNLNNSSGVGEEYMFNEVAYVDATPGPATTYTVNLQSWRNNNAFPDGISTR